MLDWRIVEGDCVEKMNTIRPGSVDLVCTDPPYGWHFMQKEFDKALPDPAVWAECLRVLKPGGFAFVMAGARSDCLWRMMAALEAAGFDVALSPILWCYRQGFPKALDVGKDFDKAAFREWAKPHLEAMGWRNAELRKAASAAVNGEYIPSDGANRKRGNDAFFAEGFDGQPRANKEAICLLASLVSRFWEPLSEAEREAVWEGHGGTDDLSRPPGVRVKVGEYHYPDGRPRKDHKQTSGVTFNCGGKAGPSNTSPSTVLAREWDGWHSAQLKPCWEAVIVAQKPFKGPIRENVRRHGVGGYNVAACGIPFSEGQSPLEERRGRPSEKHIRPVNERFIPLGYRAASPRTFWSPTTPWARPTAGSSA